MAEQQSSGANPPETDSRPTLEELEEELATLHTEETRLFQYLHDLAIMVARSQAGHSRLPEFIVDGIVKLVDATGGAIYLLDKTGSQLIPEYITTGCPALLPLPTELRGNSKSGDSAILSYLRLRGFGVDEGALGQVMRDQAPVNLARIGEHVANQNLLTDWQQTIPALISPLYYGTRSLGLLVLARDPHGEAFEDHLFEVFRGVAEQSAFALGTSLMQEEAMEKRRMESELRAASEVQRVLLPNKPPSLPGFNITARNVAARIVSGDYYDFIPINDDQLGVVIADVSGKGIPASLIMATCRGLLRGMARSVTSPSEALALVNRAIYHDMREDMFISVAYCMLQPNGNEVRLSRAGHDAPFLYTKATSKITRLEPPGLAMGVDEGPVFERVTQDYTFSMEPGDCLLLFTDGVNEAEDSSGEEFGLRRLENTFSLAAGYGAHAVMDAIRVAVQAHMGKHAQADDITMIVIERT